MIKIAETWDNEALPVGPCVVLSVPQDNQSTWTSVHGIGSRSMLPVVGNTLGFGEVAVCLGTFVEEGGSGLSVVVPDTELKVEMVGESCTEVEEEMIDKVTDEVIDEVIDGVMDEVSDEDATSDDTELDKVMNDDEVADETDAELEETSDDSNTELVVIDVDGKILTVEETTGGTGFAVGVFSKSKLFTQHKSLISGHSSRS